MMKWNDAQSKIIDFRDGNMIVSASAGSGKTTVMLERVMNLILEGTPIERIVILAFNRSIASEIRGKLYKKIFEKIQNSEEKNIEFLCEQLDNISLCNIITNDSYCNKSVKEFFEVLGVDPKLNILEEKESNILLSKSFELANEKLVENGDIWVYDLQEKFLGKDNLYSEIKRIHNFVNTIPNSEVWVNDIVKKVYDSSIENSIAMKYLNDMKNNRLNYALDCLKDCVLVINNEIEKIDSIYKFMDIIEVLINSSNYNDIYNKINSISRLPNKVKVDGRYFEDEYNRLWENAKKMYKWVKDMYNLPLEYVEELHKKTSHDVHLLLNLFNLTEDIFKEEKSKNNKFEFSDLTQLTLQLLDNENVRQSIQNRYDYICIDEYQDTNYAQEEIFSKISNGHNLFMVGDSKQSIYKFRQSEPKILLDKYEEYKNDNRKGVNVNLDYNYRSSEGIVNFVNSIFCEIMTKNICDIDYKENDLLRYGASYEKQDDRLNLAEIHYFIDENNQDVSYTLEKDVYSVKNDKASKEDEISKEGLFIANKIKSLVGKYHIYDTEIKALRPIKYRDIAILSKANSTNTKEILRAIESQNIPIDTANLSKAENIYEINIIKDFLMLIVNEMRDIELTAILSSYFVGMSYQELYELRLSDKSSEFFYEIVDNNKDKNERISYFYSLLGNLRLKASYSSVYDLANYIVYEYGYDKYLLSSENGMYKYNCVKTYLNQLSKMSSDTSLYDYVQSLDDSSIELAGLGDNDVVVATTIHKSKGLEYPIVFLCDTEDEINKSKGNNVSRTQLDKNMGIAINYYNKEDRTINDNLVYKIFRDRQKFDVRAESMRLFYVALTRAKNHIFITGTIKEENWNFNNPYSINSYREWIMMASHTNAKLKSMITFHRDEDIPSTHIEKFTFRHNEDKKYAPITKYLNYEYPHKDSLDIAVKYTVTEINKQNMYEDNVERESLVKEDLPSDAKVARGVNYHSILEHINYDIKTLEDVNNELKTMVQNEVLRGEDLENVNADEILRVIKSPLIQLARVNKHYREREFMLLVRACDILDTNVTDKVLVQGAVDLIIDGEELIVVDFKKTNKSREKVINTYSKQLELYSLAVSNALGKKVNKKIIYVIGRDEIIEL